MSINAGAAAPRKIRLAVQVVPNAKRTEVIGMHADAVKIRLQAQPVDGKANEALIHFLAARLGLPKQAICIVHGQTARRKTVEIDASTLISDDLCQVLLTQCHQA